MNAGSQDQSTAMADRHYIIGTAGHIDHGKTSLVRALTGIDADRLPEEQRRGMTIELGFADLQIGGVRLGVVDVPGHERFVRTMVAGATGIDLALLVVAGDDSVMPQTIEHVEILNLLGVKRCVVAITKIDTVDAEMVELVIDDVQRLLADSPLAHATFCPVSSVNGTGVDELRTAILEAIESVPISTQRNPFRLCVDRVFVVQGRGTVVTGSALRGTVLAGDELEVWPGGHRCRVRGLQAHGAAQESLGRGQRTAINVSGIDRDQIPRGCDVATPGYLDPSHILDVKLDCLASYERGLRSSSVVRLEIGTTEVPVRVVLHDGDVLDGGAWGYAQLRSGQPLTATYGQRFIIRNDSATRTIGGGVILRPVARRKRRGSGERVLADLLRLETGDDLARVGQVLGDAGFSSLSDLQVCCRAGVELDALPALMESLRANAEWAAIAGTTHWVTPSAVDDLASRLVGWLERYHKTHTDAPGRRVDSVVGWLERMTHRATARPLFDMFIKRKLLKVLGSFACLPQFAPSLSAADEKLLRAMVVDIKAGGFSPPGLDQLATGASVDRKRMERLATLSVALGDLIKVDGKIYLHTEVEASMRELIAKLVEKEGGVTVAQVREVLSSSRKYVVPFLEYLDRVGFTRREGDQRVLQEKAKL